MNIKPTQSPLRWVGAKRRLVSQLSQFLPNDTKKLCSPFCGGCSFELALSQQGVEVYARDNSELLIEFWTILKTEPEALITTVKKFFLPMPPSTYYWSKKEILKLKPGVFRAAMFYAINRASFSGTTLDGGMVPGHPALSVEKTEALMEVDLANIHFQCLDYKDYLLGVYVCEDVFLYLDPPYYNVDISYGEAGVNGTTFNHLELHEWLSIRNKWILSYDNHPTILQLYKDYRILYPHLTYSTRSRNGTESRDIIVISDDI